MVTFPWPQTHAPRNVITSRSHCYTPHASSHVHIPTHPCSHHTSDMDPCTACAHTPTFTYPQALCTPSWAHDTPTPANPFTSPRNCISSSNFISENGKKIPTHRYMAALTFMPSRCQTDIICSGPAAAPSLHPQRGEKDELTHERAERRQKQQDFCSHAGRAQGSSGL